MLRRSERFARLLEGPSQFSPVGGFGATGVTCDCNCSAGPTIPCRICNIPAANLTLSWNFLPGGIPPACVGSTTLTYVPGVPPIWFGIFPAVPPAVCAPCPNQQIKVTCGGSGIEMAFGFAGTFFCQMTYSLLKAGDSCSPFHLSFTFPGPFAGCGGCDPRSATVPLILTA